MSSGVKATRARGGNKALNGPPFWLYLKHHGRYKYVSELETVPTEPELHGLYPELAAMGGRAKILDGKGGRRTFEVHPLHPGPDPWEPGPPKTPGHYVIIDDDGLGVTYSSYHGVPPSLRNVRAHLDIASPPKESCSRDVWECVNDPRDEPWVKGEPDPWGYVFILEQGEHDGIIVRGDSRPGSHAVVWHLRVSKPPWWKADGSGPDYD
jgi:hypothetical protein